MTSDRRRFPRSVYRDGHEPDARFSLANERTFLAWIRTALALLAGGVALESLAPGLDPFLRSVGSVVLIVAGTLAPVQAWAGWTRTERALRQDRPLPSAALALPIGVAVILTGAAVLLGAVLP